MKILKEHLEIIENRSKAALVSSGFSSWKDWLDSVTKPSRVKNKEVWFRWIIYSHSIIGNDFDFQNLLYSYLNDSHIKTALKSVINFN